MLLKTPFRDSTSELAAGRFGMALFLTALAVLFLSTIVGVVVIRIQLTAKGEWPQDLPAPPIGLWGSTALLIASAFTAQGAWTAAQVSDQQRALRFTIATLALGVFFVIAQAGCWVAWSEAADVRWHGRESFRMAQTGFYLLTGLHAAHVLGGLAGLSWAMRQARRGRYRAVWWNVVYWHFLGVAWIVIFAFVLAS